MERVIVDLSYCFFAYACFALGSLRVFVNMDGRNEGKTTSTDCNLFNLHGLVGYDVRLTRVRSPVRARVGIPFWFS